MRSRRQTPPIYCVGPLISTNEHECLSSLSTQSSKSVVFLCFGSMGMLSTKRPTSMAIGLEKSGHRFLWVVRNSPADNAKLSASAVAKEPNLDELLPQGFLDRTRDRDLVVKSWAPQVAVLNHDSVGGFLTHCGCNSILEATADGGVRDGWVSAEELEKRIRGLMESDIGKQVRERILAFRNEVGLSMEKDGSSVAALASLSIRYEFPWWY